MTQNNPITTTDVATVTWPLASNRERGRPFIIIGNPGSRRVDLFQKALVESGQFPASLLTYKDLLAGRVQLSEIVQPDTLVRIESPDRDFGVEKSLLELGATVEDEEVPARSYARCSSAEAAKLSFEQGAILFPRQWYLGYRELLRQIRQQLEVSPICQLMNQPEAIALMFDKVACHSYLKTHGIALPTSLGLINSYAELIERMREKECYRVFVKLAHGSSASGVVAYQVSGQRHQAITTVEMEEQGGGLKLYNSRRLKTYQNPREIARLIDALCLHRALVEQWIPKAGFQNQIFDLRVVVIAGQVKHVVVRMSPTPITNLHLDNRRAVLELLQNRLPSPTWEAARHTCEKVMQLFPGSLYAGIDLLITSNYRGHAVAEVNAFGDLLYDTYYQGKNTYTVEIEALLNQEGEPETAK